MIVGLILAGGASVRMGKPKPLLTLGNETFLQRIVRLFHSVRIIDTTIVLGAYAEEIQSTLQWYSGKIVRNTCWEAGQLSSLKTGVSVYDSTEYHGILVYPVDHPLVSQQTLADLLHAFWTSDKNIVVPVHDGKRGHPVIFGKSIINQIPSLSNDVGAKELLRMNPHEILEVPVNDSGVLRNIDTPENYKQYIAESNIC